MNKQQLAAKIWESANKMRSKIEAHEYKDYILGFIFYKYLSDYEVSYLRKDGFGEDEIKKDVNEDDAEMVDYLQRNIGYFISYDNLFSTWIAQEKDFDVANVTDALSSFSRLISPTYKSVFENIFQTLETGLSKLGESSGARTKAIRELLQLIKDIPMDGRQDYDVLGFIYEYLISKFASSAGKKAGEFYTPHEVSVVMAEIVANHLKDRENIEIYDPTSGSGSLLINIGKSISKYMDNADNIKYYAQELKENTYNLTRMNLVMRGINAANIVTRCGDTLEEDWPYFDESDPARTYNPLYVDAVVSNPPYSQQWDSTHKETDLRYSRFGLAPKGKADYAFLLHDLYHIKPDGIMTIVLPHGVLFRGGEEGQIRRNLIEYNNIDTIIGLPANIFFGTGIPTIIMVLRQKRTNTDVLIIDASKGFIKDGKNNKLRASDIKKIVDTVVGRKDIPKYSRKVSLEEIRANDYNLNIPRYVDSSEKAESWDIYASMFGGIPVSELDELNEYWAAFPNLRKALFEENGTPYVKLAVEDIKKVVQQHADVKQFVSEYENNFANLPAYLKERLLDNMLSLAIAKEEAILSDDIFSRLETTSLINPYEVYQLLDDSWVNVAVDLEMIQTEGFDATRKVDPNMVIKKKDGKEQEVQEGWIGRILPFELVQKTLLKAEYEAIKAKENRLAEIETEYESIIDGLSEDDKNSSLLNDDNTAFVQKEVNAKVKDIYGGILTNEISELLEYRALTKKVEKLNYINSHKDIHWNLIEQASDATYGKKAVDTYINQLRSQYIFSNDSFENAMIQAKELLDEEKNLRTQIKIAIAEMDLLTKNTIGNLSDEQVYLLLENKWIAPLVADLRQMPDTIVNTLVNKIQALAKKYEVTYYDLENEIRETEQQLCAMIDELTGSEFDMKGLAELKTLLGGV